jgi:hypothetical protein
VVVSRSPPPRASRSFLLRMKEFAARLSHVRKQTRPTTHLGHGPNSPDTMLGRGSSLRSMASSSLPTRHSLTRRDTRSVRRAFTMILATRSKGRKVADSGQMIES